MNARDQFFNEVSVLIVDDDLPSTKLMHILLTEQGADVQTASTGKDALLRVADCRPHVIITAPHTLHKAQT